MRPSRIVLTLALLASVAGVAYVAQRAESPGVKMVGAAQGLLQSLTADQKAKAMIAFDSAERTNWNFVPLQKDRKSLRKGLSLEEMTAEQKKTALDLVRTG